METFVEVPIIEMSPLPDSVRSSESHVLGHFPSPPKQKLDSIVISSDILLLRYPMVTYSLPGGTSGKEPACQCRRHKRHGFDPWVGKIPWRRKWQPTPVFFPGESCGQRNLAGYSAYGHTESDTTEVT